jgi:iron(III) transport system substrate-binding protein
MVAISTASAALAAVLAAGVLPGCRRGAAAREVVLYSSVDDLLLRAIAGEFTKRTAIEVRIVGDTEATKVTGLVQRLIAERNAPRADVWWSSEAMGTLQLANEGLLDVSRTMHERDFADGWPAALVDSQSRWRGFGQRARVLVVSASRVKPEERPARLRDLTRPEWRGRVGIARAQFGTTRNQIAAIAAVAGVNALEVWLTGMKANGVRMYDGNSPVVQAVANGEIDVGLTDTDDVFAGQREKWPVDMIFEATDAPPEGGAGEDGAAGLISVGPLMIPNTAALVKGRPHAAESQELLDFLLSADVERMLARSESRNFPIRPEVAREVAELPRVPMDAAAGAKARGIELTWQKIADADAEAQRVFGAVFPLR